MARTPCDLCNENYPGPAVTGYHRWYDGAFRKGFKQRMCFKCSKLHFGNLMTFAVDTEDPEAVWPQFCSCGEPTENGNAEQTWTTWYRGQTKKSMSLIQCQHCSGNTRTLMMHGSESLEDRPAPEVLAGGAPLQNPQVTGGKDALPW